jgi:hypothetical protein
MKTLFVGLNVCFGIVCALLGAAFVLSALTVTYGMTYGVIGIVTLAVSAICLSVACDCRPEDDRRHA